MSALLSFVAAPTETAAVRLDLSRPGEVYVRNDGFTIGKPRFDGEPGSTGVDYGYRSLNLEVTVRGTEPAARVVLQAIAREVLRPRNWLRFQVASGAAPVWFRTYATEPADLSFENAGDGIWRITVPLVAEAFAYGERVTLPSVTVSNDPAAASNPCSHLLPAIKGDAPAPLRLAVDFSATLNQSEIMIAASPVPAGYTAPIVWQIGNGDGLTAGADTAAPNNNVEWSGGSHRTVSFATTPGMATRLSGTAPGPVPLGRYRVLVRVGRNDNASSFALRFGYSGLSEDTAGSPTVTVVRGTDAAGQIFKTWVPLGVFSFPKNQNDLAVGDASSYRPQWLLQAQRLSGTGSLVLDAVLLVPVDLRDSEPGTMLFSYFPGFGPQHDDVAHWDSDLEAFARVTAFGNVDTGIQPWPRGKYPLVHPGVANLLHLLQQTHTARPFFGDLANADNIANSALVTPSYHPRYLHLRGD